MVPSRLFQLIWLAFSVELASLGIALAMIAGRQLAMGATSAGAAAFVMALCCGGLAITAEEWRRQDA